MNDSAVTEPYAHYGGARLRETDQWPASIEGRTVTIPPSMAFVLGDNRSEAADSRLWGPVELSDVMAKVLLILP